MTYKDCNKTILICDNCDVESDKLYINGKEHLCAECALDTFDTIDSDYVEEPEFEVWHNG